MLYLFLATLIVLTHLGFIVLVVAGGLLVWRRPWFAWVHLPAALWGAWIELSGGICPLTPLENALRVRAGAEGYTGDFLDHYLVSLIYPAGLTRELQLALGAAVIVVNVAVYARVLVRWSRNRRRGRR
jgi:hypothetical protein